jgi:uncharacterized membrane protein
MKRRSRAASQQLVLGLGAHRDELLERLFGALDTLGLGRLVGVDRRPRTLERRATRRSAAVGSAGLVQIVECGELGIVIVVVAGVVVGVVTRRTRLRLRLDRMLKPSTSMGVGTESTL